MVGDDRAQIQQVHILDNDRLLVISTDNSEPQQQLMKLHQLNKLKFKTGSELTEARKKQFEDLKKKEQEEQNQQDQESDEDDDDDEDENKDDKNKKIGFKGYGDINIIQSYPSHSSCQDQGNTQAQNQGQGQQEQVPDQNQVQSQNQGQNDQGFDQDQSHNQGQGQTQSYGQDQNQGQNQGYGQGQQAQAQGQGYGQDQGQNQNEKQIQNQGNKESHTAISFNNHQLKINVWDTKSASKTNSIYLGYEPLMMALVDEKVLLLNGKKSKFVLLDLEDGEEVWESSERFVTRHLVRGRNDKCVVVKATNEFVVADERSNLKIFNLKTGKTSVDLRVKIKKTYFYILASS